jgi:uncharacterized glyoxalase superfamily protein PhnB
MFTNVSLTSEGEWPSRLRDLPPWTLPLGPTVAIAPHSDDETTDAQGMTAKLPISRVIWQLCALSVLTMSAAAQGINLNPTRPTIANSAAIQSRGVLQVETGYDAYPQSSPGNQQTLDTLFTYTPLARLRLDFDWSAFNHQQEGAVTTDGIGTIQIGGKLEFKREQDHRFAPGIAFQYEAELPTASQQALQGYGQQAILLLNHHYGKSGDLDVIVNGSLVQSDCQSRTGCSYGGQQSFALSYHLQKETRLYIEVFGQNTSQSNTPPGTYFFSGFYRQFSDAFGIDGGLRFGMSDHSAPIGTTIGLVFGKRVQTDTSTKH